jgi:hypothetical protein
MRSTKRRQSYQDFLFSSGHSKSYATTTAKPDEGFAVFKIEAIDNAKQNTPFNLDPERIYVDQTPAEKKEKSLSFQTRRFINTDPRFEQALGAAGLARTAYPANKKTDANSFVVVALGLNNPAGGPEANQYSFDLLYDTTTTEKQTGTGEVVFTKTNAADTKYS